MNGKKTEMPQARSTVRHAGSRALVGTLALLLSMSGMVSGLSVPLAAGSVAAKGTIGSNGPVSGVSTTEQGKFTLNFRDMDIDALIQAVSKVTGKNFIVDPRVKARVTVISAQPMSADKLYDVFLSILQVHGFAAVPAGDVVKIVPEINARSEDQPVNPPLNNTAGDQMVTEVVRLRFVPAAPLLTVLRQIMPQQAALSVYPNTNALVITDRASNIDRIKKILDQVDQPSVGDIQIVHLKHASATEVVKMLKSLFGASGSGAAAQSRGGNAAQGGQIDVPTFAADERTNSVLIGGDKIARAKMRAVIINLDTPETQTGNTRVFRLKYAKAEDMIKVLKGIDSLTGSNSNGGKTKGKSSAPDASFSISADKSLNALVVTASPNRMKAIESVIEQLDVRRQQVLVEAIIAEVSDDLTKKLGTQFLVGGSSGTVPIGISTFNGLLSTVSSAAATTTTSSLPLALASALGDGGNLGIGRLSSGNGTDFALLVSALSANAGNNILSTPSLLTLDNEEASIVVGQNIPIVTGSYAQTGSGTSATNPFQTISREDIGIKLKVTPTISPDGTVRMKIEQEVSSLDNSVQSSAGLITNKRNVTTTVQVDDGDVVVLGGLIDDSSSNTVQRVPGLGDIPILGNLFRYRSTQATKRNLMVFIRPLIINNRGKLTQFSKEQYRRMRQAQVASWSDDSLGDPSDWSVLPLEKGFHRNMPVPLPDNIRDLLRMDKNGGGKSGTTTTAKQ